MLTQLHSHKIIYIGYKYDKQTKLFIYIQECYYLYTKYTRFKKYIHIYIHLYVKIYEN